MKLYSYANTNGAFQWAQLLLDICPIAWFIRRHVVVAMLPSPPHLIDFTRYHVPRRIQFDQSEQRF